MVTTTRDKLHRLVEKPLESELAAAQRYLEYLEAARGLPRVLAETLERVDLLSPDAAAALAAEAQVAR